MPKVSKVTKKLTSSSPGVAAPVKDAPEKYYCSRCTRNFTKQKGNFPASQSPIFRENGGYLPVCRHCVEEMYDHYKQCLGDEKSAMRRICLKFDIYWGERVYAMLNKTTSTNSRILSYISKSNLYQFIGKTFDDTLDEEAAAALELGGGETMPSAVIASDRDGGGDIYVSQDIIDFWGNGLTPSFYIELEKRYRHWMVETGRTDLENVDAGEKALIRQICILECSINRDVAAGKSVDKNVNTLNNLLGSANLKPNKKNKDDAIGGPNGMTPFGVWIRRIEDTRPIADAAPEFQDVDGIVKYISIWFLGHLCKMLRIKNKYSELYEEEMERLRVQRPEYEGDDEETILADIFERAQKSDLEGEEPELLNILGLDDIEGDDDG